jgi:peptide/nickel transport system substrate-binding protein
MRSEPVDVALVQFSGRRDPTRRVERMAARVRHVRSTLAVGVLVLSLVAACTSQAPRVSNSGARTIATIALRGVGVGSLNPYAHTDGQIYPTWAHVVEPLVDWDWQQKAIVPILAESWSTPDPNTWIFKLKQGIKFHDGGDFTADDVVYSFEDRLKNDPDSRQRETMAHVDAIEALDPHTVRLHTRTPDAALLFRLPQRYVISKAVHDRLGKEEGDRQVIGTGPYRFKEWTPTERFVVEKNASYTHSTHQPTVDTAVFRGIKEQEAAVSGLLNGEFDLISGVMPESSGRLTGNVHTETARDTNVMFLGMNATVVPQLGNTLVRQAVSYAIDRHGIVDGILKGRGYILDAPIGPEQNGYPGALEPRYDYSPAKARELLRQAGYAEGFEVDLYTTSGQYNKDREIGTAIAGMLSDVGIRARLQTPEFPTYFTAIQKGEVGLYFIARGSVVDPSEYLHQFFETGVTKRVQYSNAAVDAALAAEQVAFDPAERALRLKEAMSRLWEDVPIAWLFQYQTIYGVSNRFDYRPSPEGKLYAWDLRPR